MAREIDPKSEETKKKFRKIGIILVSIGIICTLIGGIDFFSAFNNMRQPKLFWLLFIGIPLIGLGGSCLSFSYVGSITRFTAGQTAPVAKDTVNYLLDGTKDKISETVKSIKNVKEDESKTNIKQNLKCSICDRLNDENAKFCDRCGVKLKNSCLFCNTENDKNATYCKNCGKQII